MVSTSLVPTVIALSQFFARNFPHIFWYPYWYLGVPYNYLIGPGVPILLTIFNLQFSRLPIAGTGGQAIYNSYLFLIFVSFVISAIGIYFLVKSFGKGNKQAILASVFFLFMPFGYFLLYFGNGLNNIAFSFVPFIFIFYKKILEQSAHKSVRHWILLSILISLVLLINVSTVLTVIIGFLSLYFVFKGREINAEIVIKTALSVLLSVSIATIWYTPGFWIVNITNPSVGGMPLLNLFGSVLNFLFNFIPIILVVVFFRWRRYKPKDSLLVFSSIFFFSYLFLSIVRFSGNPAFWEDWITYGFELGFALSIIISHLIFKLKGKLFPLLPAAIVLLLFLFSYFSIISLFNADNTYISKITSWISKMGPNKRVFLSGSSVFWINSRLNVMQVRGGADSSSLFKTWADGAWQIREGQSKDLTKAWLSVLGINYILVNDSSSREYYRDFKTPDKFSVFNIVNRSKGDTLYYVPDVWIARAAKDSLLNVPAYTNGADLNSLSSYTNSLVGRADFSYINPQEISVSANLNKNEVISMAVSYSPDFKITRGQGQLTSDSYGNMVIAAQKTGFQTFTLSYIPNPFDYLLPFIFSILIFTAILYYPKIFPKLKNRINLHTGIFEEEEY